MKLFSDTGKAIRNTNVMEDCLTQIKMDKSLNEEIKAKFSIALNTKKASRKRFVNLFGNFML